MAGAFAITSATNTVTLDAEGRGEATFTVTNKTGHALQARATAVALPPTNAALLRVVGESQRLFPLGGTEQFAVAVALGAGTSAGLYPFRLDVASVTVPDEEWEQGPVVQFQAPEVPIPPKVEPVEPPGYLETAVGAVIGALALAAIVALVVVILGAITNQLAGGAIVGAILGAIATWPGACVGAGVALSIRKFTDPWVTAIPLLLLVPFLGGPIVIGLTQILSAVKLPDVLSFPLFVLALLLGTVIPALAARAVVRWRRTGHL